MMIFPRVKFFVQFSQASALSFLNIPLYPTNCVKMAEDLHVKGKDLKDLKVFLINMRLFFASSLKYISGVNVS